MHIRLTSCLLALALLPAAPAAEIQGVVIIKRKLTKRLAAPALDVYERGAAVASRAGTQEANDPLSYDRTHTVIFLEGDLPASRPMQAAIQQENRAFSPDLAVVPAGSSISFPNLDPIFHNVFSLSKIKSFDLGNYSKGQTRMVIFPKPGIVLVNCRIHTNMSAVVVVTPNEFYASADVKGSYAIKNVPPGKYVVVAWHKAAGFLRKEIEVGEGATVKLDFLVPLQAEPEARLTAERR